VAGSLEVFAKAMVGGVDVKVVQENKHRLHSWVLAHPLRVEATYYAVSAD